MLGISRGSVYYLPRSVSSADLALLRWIDELHLDYPFAGARMLRDLLAGEGIRVGRLHVSTLMKRMGIEAIYRKLKPASPHRATGSILPAAQACGDAAQPGLGDGHHLHPMARGFVYLAAVIDWFSRRVLSWRLSIAWNASFCIEAVEEALGRYSRPEIFNTDQGSQSTSRAFTKVLRENEIAISMDGRGSWRDNVFVERLWRSIKYEEVYLRAYETVSHAPASIGRYLAFDMAAAHTRALTERRPTPPTLTR